MAQDPKPQIKAHEQKPVPAAQAAPTSTTTAQAETAPTPDQRRIADLEASLKSAQAEYEVLSTNASTLAANHAKLKAAFDSLNAKYTQLVDERDALAKQLTEAKKGGGGVAARP